MATPQQNPRKSMYLLDMWEALSRNRQYQKDYADFCQHSRSLASMFEGGELLEQIKIRENRAGLTLMPDPKKIPGIIQTARSQAEKLVPENKKGNRERRVREKMERLLPNRIFQPLSDAVKQIPYRPHKAAPSQYQNVEAEDTYDFLRKEKFWRVEID